MWILVIIGFRILSLCFKVTSNFPRYFLFTGSILVILKLIYQKDIQNKSYFELLVPIYGLFFIILNHYILAEVYFFTGLYVSMAIIAFIPQKIGIKPFTFYYSKKWIDLNKAEINYNTAKKTIKSIANQWSFWFLCAALASACSLFWVRVSVPIILLMLIAPLITRFYIFKSNFLNFKGII